MITLAKFLGGGIDPVLNMDCDEFEKWWTAAEDVAKAEAKR